LFLRDFDYLHFGLGVWVLGYFDVDDFDETPRKQEKKKLGYPRGNIYYIRPTFAQILEFFLNFLRWIFLKKL